MAETIDFSGTWKGIYVTGAGTYFGGNAGGNITSITGTLGYNIHIKGGTWIMPIVRYDFMKGNFANSNIHSMPTGYGASLSSDSANQITVLWGGVNFFIDKHLLKLQLFYALNVNNYKGYDASGNSLGGYNQNLIIFQAQGTFWTGADIALKPDNVRL